MSGVGADKDCLSRANPSFATKPALILHAYNQAGLWGFHHVQFTTKNMDASVEIAKSAGLELVCTISQGGGIYNYLRGPGVWFEMI